MLIFRRFLILAGLLSLPISSLHAQDAAETPGAKEDWITFLAKNPRVLPKEFHVGGRADLLTAAGQMRFMEKKRNSPSVAERSVANMMQAWQKGPAKEPVPVDAIRLVLDPKFRVPGTPRSQVLQLALYQQDLLIEVNPGFGADTLKERFPQLEAMLDKEKERREACASAVQQLQTKVSLPGVAAGFDRIRGFSKVCLFTSGNTTAIRPLTEFESQHATACAKAYAAFVSKCYGPESFGRWQKALSPHLGIIVTKASRSHRRSIVCSGVEVAPGVILTARHCLAEFPAAAGAWFRPVGDDSASIEEHAITEAMVAPEFKREKLGDAVAAFKRAADENTLNRSQDIALLRTAKAAADVNWPAKVGVRPAEALESVVLMGFQRLKANAMLLSKRLKNEPLFNDEDLLATGTWREAFTFDANPTCILVPFQEEEYGKHGLTKGAVLGHLCQSLDSTSGGGLIALPKSADGMAYVVAVHAGPLFDESLSLQGIPVETVRPSNFGVVVTANLRKTLGE